MREEGVREALSEQLFKDPLAEALLSLTCGFRGHLRINTETAEMDRT